jgi:hypothetical protein
MLPFGLDLGQIFWSIVYLIGFGMALHQAEDHEYAKKFAYLTGILTILCWIGYEYLRIRSAVPDEWLLLMPKVLIFWNAFCALIRAYLHPDGLLSSRIILAAYGILMLVAAIGVGMSVTAA